MKSIIKYVAFAAFTIGTYNNALAQTNQTNSQMESEASVKAVLATDKKPNKFTEDEVTKAVTKFFGNTSGSVGRAVEKVFKDQGEPVGYIEGTEWSASAGFGLRYGKGKLVMKNGETRQINWQGPSIGFDTGANASKVFTLVYNLGNPDAIYRRYPGIDGSAFFIAGIAVNYQQAEGVILAPMRTGVGLRAGVSAGYSAYSKERRILPF